MGCTEPSGVYRPRRPRESPLWRLTEEHLETFKQVYDDRFAQRYGFWRAQIERTLLAFLDCGDFEQGFARVRCDACRRELLVALSCKTRGYCPSCNAKRSVLWAEWLTGEVLEPVDHLHWVFTVPKRLRLFFLYDRKLLGERGKLDEDAATSMLDWRHSGFSVHNQIRADAADSPGLERLSRYLVHPPIAQERLRYAGPDAPCSYRGRRAHPLTGQDRVELDPLEMLARLCQHIPPPGFHTTRLYGAYSNRTRAARKRVVQEGRGGQAVDLDAEAYPLMPSQRERRRQWARLIAKVFEVDPLRCPCGATMRIVAVILQPPVIRKILDHLARPEPRAHAPPSAG